MGGKELLIELMDQKLLMLSERTRLNHSDLVFLLRFPRIICFPPVTTL